MRKVVLSNGLPFIRTILIVLPICLCVLAGCTPPAQEKSWDCTYPDNEGKWDCTSLHTNRVIHCSDDVYIVEEPEPVCIPEWCDLPMQSCDLPPLTGGTDSCGQPCSKPSEQWSNCIQ